MVALATVATAAASVSVSAVAAAAANLGDVAGVVEGRWSWLGR